MIIDGFVQTCQARLEVLYVQIRDIIQKDGGRKVFSHMRSQMTEVKKLNDAIYKAQRKGVRE